jgi:segregation and condensation protein B
MKRLFRWTLFLPVWKNRNHRSVGRNSAVKCWWQKRLKHLFNFIMELKFILESLLFSAQKPLSMKELRDALSGAVEHAEGDETVLTFKKVKEEELLAALEQLAKEHEEAKRSYRLACIAGSWQFVTQPEFAPWLKALVGVKARPPRLSQAALETLAIIAYRQPITRAEVEQIRGVNVDGTMQTLLERGVVESVGRAEVVGRPALYGTTAVFMEYFGLRSLDDLPAADELRKIVIEKPAAPLTVDPGLATAPPEQLAVVENNEGETHKNESENPQATP